MNPLWLGPRRAAQLAERFGTPLYVYSARVLRARCRALTKAFSGVQIRYAMKANANPTILKTVQSMGLGVDTVSAAELRLATELGFTRGSIAWSGNNPDDEELTAVRRAGVVANLDALGALKRYGEMFGGARVSLRLNLEVGGGHHPHVVTAGPDSKFGLALEDIPEARVIAKRYGLKIAGVHQHIGSGIFDLELFLEAFDALMAVLPALPELEFVDIGGGFGVPYRPEEKAIDLPAWGAAVLDRWRRVNAARTRPLQLVIEPGRYVVAESGVLVAKVTTIKRSRDRVFVGVDSGMHHLVRPALYQSFHPVKFVPKRAGRELRTFVVGPICESGDVLAEERLMVTPEPGDLMVLGCAGAYGYSMASQYNLRARPAEVMVDGPEKAWLIRHRESYSDLVRRRDLRGLGVR